MIEIFFGADKVDLVQQIPYLLPMKKGPKLRIYFS